MSTNNLEYLAGQVQTSLQKRKNRRKRGRRSKKVNVSSGDVVIALTAMSENGMRSQAAIVMFKYRLSMDGRYSDRRPIKGNGVMHSREMLQNPGVSERVKVFLRKYGSGKAFSDLVYIVGQVK